MMGSTCTPSISAYCRQMTVWICRHVCPKQSGISRTKVQVLSRTSCIPPDIHCPSSTSLSETWARKRSYPQPEYYPDKLTDGIGGNSICRARSKHSKVNENDPPTCCVHLPGLLLSRWRRRRRAKVAPFIPLSTSRKPPLTSLKAGNEAPAQLKAMELSVFDLEDEDDQESPSLGLPSRQMMKEDFDEWRRRERRVTHIGDEQHEIQDEIQGISREMISLPARPKTSRGLRSESDQKDRPSVVKTQELSGHEVNIWTRECGEVTQVVMNPQLPGSKTINKPGSCNDNLDVDKTVSVKSRRACDTFEQNEVVVTGRKQILTNNDTQWEYAERSTETSKVEPLPPRPKTSRGTRGENGRGDSLLVSSAVRVVEAGLEQAVREVLVLDTAESLELTNEKRHFCPKESRGSGDVLYLEENLNEVGDDERNQTHASRRGNEHDTKAKEDKFSPPNCEKQNQPITPKSSKNSVDADDMMITAEEEMEYERQQHEQWRLAAIGEWSTLCQDHDEDDYESQCYLRMDEFQKETAIMMEWKAIVEQYRTVGVIQDLQNIETLCKSTINQSERALRQFARICRGPVPLSKSGQTKAEAIASLSRIIQKQTRRICEDISNVFSETYQIFEELDLLRERQDRVEESLQRDLSGKDAEKELSRSSSLSSTITPRLTSSRLQQREIDQDLVDRYMEYPGVKSTSLFNVMPTIYEDKTFQLDEYEEEEEELESDLPECNRMEDFYLHEDDVRQHDTAEGDCEDVLLMEELGVKN